MVEAEKNGREQPTTKESIITPEKVKSRVMDFFKGADLEKASETKLGIVTIRTTIMSPNTIGDEAILSDATVNGRVVAEYWHHYSVPKSPAILETYAYRLYGLIGKDPCTVETNESILGEKKLPMAVYLNFPSRDATRATRVGDLNRKDLKLVAKTFGI